MSIGNDDVPSWEKERQEQREKSSAEWAAFLNTPYSGPNVGDYQISKTLYDTIDPSRKKPGEY
jgi:hypothetical protein